MTHIDNITRHIICLFFIISAFVTNAGEKEPQIILSDFKETRANNSNFPNMVTFMKDWPADYDGKDCALIRVHFIDFSPEDINRVKPNFGTASLIKTDYKLLDEESTIWYFVSPRKSTFIQATLTGFGASNRISGIKLKEKCVYDVNLINKETISISINSKPEGYKAILDFDDYKEKLDSVDASRFCITNGTIDNVTQGKHILTIFTNDGEIARKEVVNISKTNKVFDFEFRKFRTIKFISKQPNTDFYIDGELIKKSSSNVTEVRKPYGIYTVEARSATGDSEIREVLFNGNTQNIITFNPVKKITFNIAAFQDDRKIAAQLYINDIFSGQDMETYTLTRPLGETLTIKMVYQGDQKEKTITVTEKMSGETEKFKIKRHKTHKTHFPNYSSGLSFGYVMKQMVTKGGGKKFSENGVWSDGDGQWLNGLQFGVHFQPTLWFGLGFYTGAFYEFYYSKGELDVYNRYMEHCCYVPAHLFYNIRFSNRVTFAIHAGIGFNYNIYGSYSDTENYNDDYSGFYGEQYYPKRINWAAEAGANISFGRVTFGFVYSQGLNDHESYIQTNKEYKTTINKMAFTFSIGI